MFVARTQELARLRGFLDRALSGQGQLCFITGEPGSGKTILVREFVRLAQEEHPDLIAAWSDCNAQTGVGDPYLPFREVLSQLIGNVEAALAAGIITAENANRLRRVRALASDTLLEVGPDLIGTMISGQSRAQLAAFLNDTEKRPAIGHLNFDLEIEPGEAGYRSQVLNSPAGEGSADVSLPPISELAAPPHDVGRCLFEAVFCGQVLAAFRRSLDVAQGQGQGLRVRLRLPEAPELANLPWELLFDPDRGSFLSLSRETPVVRYLDLPEPPRPIGAGAHLRVLAIIASPSDYPPLKTDQEWDQLQEALGVLQARGIVTVDRLTPPSLAALQRQLSLQQYDIIHFLGHGAFDAENGDSVLLFERKDGTAQVVSGQTFSMFLHDHRTLRLALLNACEGAETSGHDHYSGVAQRLVQGGVPAVIAMRTAISDQGGVALASAFYSSLADGAAVDVALTEARKALFAGGTEPEWATPVLYMRSADGNLWQRHDSQLVADLARRKLETSEPSQSGADREHVHEQYSNFLWRLAEQQPLLLVIDDLHWADASSISLLFHLARRRASSRLLIVGTSRPTDVALGRGGERHPFDKVLPEFKRYLGDIILPLDDTDAANARSFVDAYLDSEPNRLGNDFRTALTQRTGGNPLFTAELLRDMQERGDLRRAHEGYWLAAPGLRWDRLPAQVEGVIEERIGRLSTELRETLTCASMEGDSFAAELVARLRSVQERDLIRSLSGELAKQHRLVEAEGVARLGAQRLSLYRFRHMLVRKYLYDQIDVIERSQLHEDVGHILEELYADRLDEVAVQLAWHFTEAGVPDKAIAYLRRAGELAAVRYASAEAADYFTRALALTPEADLVARFALVAAREEAHSTLGAREAQRTDLTLLAELAEALDDDRRRAEATLRRASLEWDVGNPSGCAAHANAALTLTEAAGDRGLHARSLVLLGLSLVELGSLDDAQLALEKALGAARHAGVKTIEASCLSGLATVLAEHGELEASHTCERQALEIRYELGDLPSICRSLNDIGFQQMVEGDPVSAIKTLEEALRLSRQVGFRSNEGFILMNLGACALALGDHRLAQAHQSASYRLADDTEDLKLGFFLLVDTVEVLHQLGRPMEEHREALRLVEATQEVSSSPRGANSWAALGLALGDLGRAAESAEAYGRALAIWRDRGDRVHELRALAGLARAAFVQGDLGPALSYVEQTLPRIADSVLVNSISDGLFSIYLTCYRVLAAVGDPRAAGVLEQAHRLVQERAARIPNPEQRRSFTENLIEVRAILVEHARRTDSAADVQNVVS